MCPAGEEGVVLSVRPAGNPLCSPVDWQGLMQRERGTIPGALSDRNL